MTLNGGSMEECSPFLSICSHHDEFVGLSLVESFNDSQYEFYFCNTKCIRGFFNKIIDDLESREGKLVADQEDLSSVAESLKSSSKVEIKGAGVSAFVCATSLNGSIEFSCNAEDSYWVEFYKPNEDVAFSDATFYSIQEALVSINRWLGGKEI